MLSPFYLMIPAALKSVSIVPIVWFVIPDVAVVGSNALLGVTLDNVYACVDCNGGLNNGILFLC